MNLTPAITGQEKYAANLEIRTLDAYKECAGLAVQEFILASINQLRRRNSAAQKIIFYSVKAKNMKIFSGWLETLTYEEKVKLSKTTIDRIAAAEFHELIVIQHLSKILWYSHVESAWGKIMRQIEKT